MTTKEAEVRDCSWCHPGEFRTLSSTICPAHARIERASTNLERMRRMHTPRLVIQLAEDELIAAVDAVVGLPPKQSSSEVSE